MDDTLVIANSHWRVGLLPETGGAVGFGQARIGDAWVDLMRPTTPEHRGVPWDTASYPLFPYSNRIRHGTLLWDGEAYQLRRWGTEDFAMHGTAAEFPWEVTARGTDHACLEFDARGFYGVSWPWDFVARVTLSLDRERFTWRLELDNVDDEAFPAGVGHHPFFVRALRDATGAPLGAPAQLQINCDAEYALTNGMAEAAAGPVVANDDYRTLRDLGTAHVDTCLTARTSPIMATIDYAGAAAIDIEADDTLGHCVVYVPQGRDFFAVEPVSNANDGFTLRALGVDGHGVRVVEPGDRLAAEFSFTLR